MLHSLEVRFSTSAVKMNKKDELEELFKKSLLLKLKCHYGNLKSSPFDSILGYFSRIDIPFPRSVLMPLLVLSLGFPSIVP
jgi:hypothetical protein